LIVIGESWRLLFETFFRVQVAYISPAVRSLLTFASTVDDAVAHLPKQ
jgi:hypothetical protein